ncbi:MAG: putative transcriptional regulator [Herbinix sp.]|jgi:DNA-binding PadR family transcriptional regulator|nr:putative transcriptional regulator [Herbinix sp.]
MAKKEEILSGLLLELRRGTIVLSVLCQLSAPTYGYSLVQELSGNEVPIEANTLYPLLRRLEKQGLLKSEWETSGAKPRKYYMLTDLGSEVYVQLKGEWNKMVVNMTKLMKEDKNNE